MKRLSRIVAPALFVAAFFLVTCRSVPDLPLAESGASLVSGGFVLDVTEGKEGREVTIAGWKADKKRIKIPEKIGNFPVAAIGSKAFADKTLLEEVVVPASVRRISAGAFDGSSALKKITAHQKNPRFISIAGILYDKDTQDKICYPPAKSGFDYDLVRKDGEGEPYTLSVSGYKGRKANIRIPDAVQGYPVTGIADRAFAGLDFLKRITLPRYLAAVGVDPFEKCRLLEEFVLSPKNAGYEVSERDLYDKKTGKLVWYPEAQAYFKYETISMDEVSYIIITGAGNEKKKAAIPAKLNGTRVSELASGAFENNQGLTEIDVPDSILKIGARSFAFCSNLRKVALSSNLSVIPVRAFYECAALKEMVIPDSVTVVSGNAFSDCTALETVALGRRLTTLENSAFSGCSALQELVIPERVTAIGENVFAGCLNLASIRVDEKNRSFADVDGVLFNKAQTAILRFPEGRSEKQYTIPASVEQIGTSAFSFCQRLSAISLPEKLTVIGNSAFFYCASLYEIRLGERVLAIGNDAFSGCTNLDRINFPESLRSIGDRAFAACRTLTTASISRNVISIGENAFRSCDRLTRVSLSRSTDAPPTVFAETSAVVAYTD
jgi:hypothetical protein